jgi:hypothetical protein
MSCENPLHLPNPRYRNWSAIDRLEYARSCFGLDFLPDKYIEVPCGMCQACEKRRMFDFRVRLMYELSVHPFSAFVTLTFDDASLSRFRDDPNKAIRLFLDRVRKTYGKQVRHWICAEYGTLRDRLHYHGILL